MAKRSFQFEDVVGVDGGWQPTGRFEHKDRRYYAECICACGKLGLVLLGRGGRLTTNSCVPCNSKRGRFNLQHGHCTDESLSPTYKSWCAMRARCKHSYVVGYHNYGGRGITVCDRWQSFENFLADMGPRPSKDHQIDRVDNDGNYEPSNCRWATRREQSQNRRTNTLIEYNGIKRSISQWAEAAGLHFDTFLSRLERGWTMEQALTTPLKWGMRK